MKNPFSHFVVISLILLAPGCSTLFSHRDDADSQEKAQEKSKEAVPETDSQKIQRLEAQNSALKAGFTELNTKIDTLQTQLTTLNDKVESTRVRMDMMLNNTKAQPTGVVHAASDTPALPPAGDNVAEANFTTSEPIQKYRQAMILFESHSYPEAIIAFTKFVDTYPDHALAGSAQYYLGESYFKQGEFKLAAKEFEKVITSYDRSPHISDTLRDLSISEDKSGQKEPADRHRQLLSSLFPNSPAASDSSAAPEAAPAAQAPQAAPPAPAIAPPPGEAPPANAAPPPTTTETAPQ